MSTQINSFIVYAREDKEIKQELLKHLNPFCKPYNLVIWHDENIEAGEEWEKKIRSRLEMTDIFIMLVSIDFMNSSFINEVEFKAAIDRHRAGRSSVIPVIIKACQYDIALDLKDYQFSLAELQLLPDGAKPLEEWESYQQGLNNVAAGVRKVLNSLQNREKEKLQKQEAEKNQKEVEQQKLEEDQVWRSILNSNDKSSFQNYINQYPKGRYVSGASQKIKEFDALEKELKRKAGVEAKKKSMNIPKPPPILTNTVISQVPKINTNTFNSWWLLLPVTMALSVAALYLGRSIFNLIYGWTGIQWPLRTLSDDVMIITGCAWGLVYGITGMISEPKGGSLLGFFAPFPLLTEDKEFLGCAPVINYVVIQAFLTGADFLAVQIFNWTSDTFYVIAFIVSNLFLIISYCTSSKVKG